MRSVIERKKIIEAEEKIMIIKALKAMAVLTMLIPATWMMFGMILSAIVTK